MEHASAPSTVSRGKTLLEKPTFKARVTKLNIWRGTRLHRATSSLDCWTNRRKYAERKPGDKRWTESVALCMYLIRKDARGTQALERDASMTTSLLSVSSTKAQAIGSTRKEFRLCRNLGERIPESGAIIELWSSPCTCAAARCACMCAPIFLDLKHHQEPRKKWGSRNAES